MKKIIFFHPVDDNYGSSNILAYVLSFLSKEYECIVYVPKINGCLKQTLHELNAGPVVFKEYSNLPIAHRAILNPKGLFKWLMQNIGAIRLILSLKKSTDLIYINTLSLFSLSFLCRILLIKNIVHCHEYLKSTIQGSVMKLVTWLSANAVISVSSKVNSYISVNQSKKYHTIRNGIPDLMSKLSEPMKDNDKINIAFIARVMPEKGHWFVVEALSLLDSKIRNTITVHVFGDSPPLSKYLYQDFQALISNRKLTDNIILHGFDAGAASRLKDYDVSLVPSIIVDSFPTTVLEAMRAGKPVITTNNGGATELISDNYNGYLVSPNDIEGLAKVFTLVVEERDKLPILGSNSRSLFKENYTIEHFKERFIKVLKEYV